MKDKLKLLLFLTGTFVLLIGFSAISNPSATLSQARNGTDASPINPLTWVSGNVGSSNGHYMEGMSIPYQCHMTDMQIGVQVTLTIGYDVRRSGKHAIDYLTHYDRMNPHTFQYHTTPEIIDPLSGTVLSASTPFSTYPIPSPSSAGSPVAGMPTNSFNSLGVGERLMTLYNGTIDSIFYVTQGNLTASSSEARITIKFTPAGSTVVLLWGGHIASRYDWGFTAGAPNSAGGISGSPFHTSLISWNFGSLGGQDRSLSGVAVAPSPPAPLPVSLLAFTAITSDETVTVKWSTASEVNNDYFTLERANENLHFESIAHVDGAGNSNSVISYEYLDDCATNGLNYYRLIQKDFNGLETVYGPISLRVFEIPIFISHIFPNPFIDDLSITFNSKDETRSRIDIWDAYGKTVFSETINTFSGINYYHFTNENHLTPGVYYISLSQADTKSYLRKIVKK